MNNELMDIGFDTGFALPPASAGKALEQDRRYDVLVLGGGPAGLSAAVYLIRKGLDTGMITGNIGGQVTWTSSIENYLGYRFIEGIQLVEKFNDQLKNFPLGIGLGEEVTAVEAGEGSFEVVTAAGKKYKAGTIILATGKRSRTLNVPGENKLLGRGVAYCAICDAPLYQGKVTAVVGGGNSGLEAAIDLARGCPKVYIIERDDRLTGDAVLIDTVEGLDNVELLTKTEVVEIFGEETVSAVKVRGPGDKTMEVAVEGVFVEIGLVTNSEPFRGLVDLNEWKEVEVDCAGRTSLPGVFAAGDVTSVPFKQIVIAAGDGAKAALSAHRYLLRHDNRGT